MQWHDLLGAVLIDFFEGSPYIVQAEIDLSLKKQLLDIVIIRKGEGELDRPLPDGFAPLANHNLITFKSHQDTFDWWTLLELIAHYVNYRKQASSSFDDLLSEGQFQLIGITSRFPDSLAKQIRLEEKQAGVYDMHIGPTRIRLVVIRDLADEPINAVLKLFSIVPKQIAFACEHYRPMHDHISGIVDALIRMYRKEDLDMISTLEEFKRKLMKEAMETASVEERLKGLTTEQILKRLSPEEIEAYLREIKKKKPKRK